MRSISHTINYRDPSTPRLLLDDACNLLDIREMTKEVGCSGERYQTGPVGEQRGQGGGLETKGEG